MPGFNQVSLARHAHGLLLALQQVQARAPQAARPVPPLLHEHISVITAALQRLHEQFSQLIGGDPLVVKRGDGGIRPDDVLNLARWWQDGRLTHLIHKIFLLAVRDIATVCAKAPGGPSSVNVSRVPSRAVSRASSAKGTNAPSEVERAQRTYADFEQFLATPKAIQCSASMVVLQGVLQLVLDALQLLRNRPPASLHPPPPLPPPPPPPEGEFEQGECAVLDAEVTCVTIEAGAGTAADSDAEAPAAQPQPTELEPGQTGLAAESSMGSVRSRGNGSRYQSGAAANSPRTTVEVEEEAAPAEAASQVGKLPPLKPAGATATGAAAAAAASATQGQPSQPAPSSPQRTSSEQQQPSSPPSPPRPEDERYQRLCARHRHAERLHQAWSGLQDAVLDLLCNSSLLTNLTELLRYTAALLALPNVVGSSAGGGSAPRTLALWRQAWSVIPLVAALGHGVAAAAAVSLLAPPPSPPPTAGPGPPLHHVQPSPLMDPESAAVLLAALAECSLVPACCDLVLAVSRSALQHSSVTRNNVTLAAQQLLAASLRLSAVAEAGGAFTPKPLPPPAVEAVPVEKEFVTAERMVSPIPDTTAALEPPQGRAAEEEESGAARASACVGEGDGGSGDGAGGDGAGGSGHPAAPGNDGAATEPESEVRTSMLQTAGRRLSSNDSDRGSRAAEVRASSDAVRANGAGTRVSHDAVRVSGDADKESGAGGTAGGAAGGGVTEVDPPSRALPTEVSAGGASDAVPPQEASGAEPALVGCNVETVAPREVAVASAAEGNMASEAEGVAATVAAGVNGRGQDGEALAGARVAEGPAASGPSDFAEDADGALQPKGHETTAVSAGHDAAAAASEATRPETQVEGDNVTTAVQTPPPATPPSRLPPLPAGGAAALAVLSSPAVQYFLCERQASAVVQAYYELAAIAPPPPPAGGGKTSVTAAASASESLSTTWIVEPLLTGAAPPPGVVPSIKVDSGDTAAAAGGGGLSVAGVLDVARYCGLDLLPVPALPWSVPVEAALVALPDIRAVQQVVAKAASSGGAVTSGGAASAATAAIDASVGPLGHHLRTESARGAVHSAAMRPPSSFAGGPAAAAAAAAAIINGPLGVQLGRRRHDGKASGATSGGGAGSGGGMVMGPTAGPKLPPLRMPLRQLDSDARRREAQKAQRQQEAMERETQLVALVKATAATWQGLIAAAAAAAGPAAGGDGHGGDGAFGEYVCGAAGRPATPSGHVPSASRALLQLVSTAAVCRAARTAAVGVAAAAASSQSGGGHAAARAGSPPRARSSRGGRGGAGDDDTTAEEGLAELLATLVRNLTAAHKLCSEPERTALHEQLAALLAAALAASQSMLARTGSPDVSTPLVTVPEACLDWMAEAERQRALELAVSEREMEAADLAAAAAEAVQLERALTRPDEEFTDEEYAAWQRLSSGSGGDAAAASEAARGLSRAAEALARAAAVRLAAAARDAARLRVAVAMCEACVRFLVAHHQGMVATLLRAGLLRPGLKLREEHTRHAGLLQQTLGMLAHLAACCASAVAEAHAPRALHDAAASTAALPHRSPLALAAASHAMVATAVGATYAPVLRALHSALLSVRKCLAVCSQQLAAGGGAALGLEPVAGVCAVLCAFPGRLVAQLLPAHELAVLRQGSARARADTGGGGGSGGKRANALPPPEHAGRGPADVATEADGGPFGSSAAAKATAGQVVAAAHEAPKEDTASEPLYENGGDLPAASKPQYAWGLEPIIEVSELSSGMSSYLSQAQHQRQQRRGNARKSSTPVSNLPEDVPEEDLDGMEGEAVDDLDSPQGGGGADRATAPGVEDSEQQGYDMDFEDADVSEDAASTTAKARRHRPSAASSSAAVADSRRASGISAVEPQQSSRAAAAVAAAVPYLARAIASSALYTTVPAAWRVFTSLFLQLASVEMTAEEQQQQLQQQQRPVGLSWAPLSSSSRTNDGATAYSNGFSSSRIGGSAAWPPPTAAAASPSDPGSAVPRSHGSAPASSSALSAEQLAALSSATTGLWDLLHVLLSVHRGAGAPWPAEAFALPTEREAELRRVLGELQRPRAKEESGEPPQRKEPRVQDGGAAPQLDGNGPAAAERDIARGLQDDGAVSTTAAAAIAGSLSGLSSGGGFSSDTGLELLSAASGTAMQDGADGPGPSPRPSGGGGIGTAGGELKASRPIAATMVAGRASDGVPATAATQDGAAKANPEAAPGSARVSTQNGPGLVLGSVIGGADDGVDASDLRRSGGDDGGDVGAAARGQGTREQMVSSENSVATATAGKSPSDAAAAAMTATDDSSELNGSEPSPAQQQEQEQPSEPDQPAAAAAADPMPSLASKVPAWREAVMLLEQVFSLSEAWKELKAAESALEGNAARAHAPRLLLGDVPAPAPAPPSVEPSPTGDEPSAAALLASFLRGGGATAAAADGAANAKARPLHPNSGDITAAAATAALPKLILNPAEAACAMGGMAPSIRGRAASLTAASAAAAAAPPPGCSYGGCTVLAGASEVVQGRNLVCRCGSANYCSATCQMLDWMDGHHRVCKSRPLKNSASAAPGRAAPPDAVATQAAGGFVTGAEPIGAAAAMGAAAAARASVARRTMATRR